MTKPLSPAAQAVLLAADENCERFGPMLAAALRAAADQVVPEETTPWNSTLVPLLNSMEVRKRLIGIAAELEQTQ